MSNVYRLKPDDIPNDSTVNCLTQLLTLAKRGKCKGVAFVAYLPEYEYIANSAGEAYADPNLTRGMLLALSDKLALRINGGNL